MYLHTLYSTFVYGCVGKKKGNLKPTAIARLAQHLDEKIKKKKASKADF
jgi:hypothetical protein